MVTKLPAVLAGLLDVLLVPAVGAHDFGDVVALEDVVLVRVVTEAALVCLLAARSLESKLCECLVQGVPTGLGPGLG